MLERYSNVLMEAKGNQVSFLATDLEVGLRSKCAATITKAGSLTLPAKKFYEIVARKFLAEGSIIYLYHTQVLVAHSDKVEGYKQLPDGLVRVVGVKLK